MIKRAFCLLISLIIILSVFPAQVLAAPGAPIVIVPGFMGSKLYADSEFNQRVFGEYGTAAEFLTVDQEQFFVKSPVNLQKAAEFGAGNRYKALCNGLSLAYPKRKIYFFSYDFTKGTKDAATKLNNFINGLGEKVDMVCYSYGGLVATHYFALDSNNYNKVDKTILIGVPFEGTLYANLAVDKEILDKDVLGELLPTKKYIEKMDMTGDGGVNQDYLYSDGKSVMAKKQNAYYAIGGGKITASKIVYNEDGSIADVLFDNNGDGVVTYNSATIFGDTKNIKMFKTGHNGLLTSQEVISWVTSVISNKETLGEEDLKTGYDLIKINGDADIVVTGGMGVMEQETPHLVQNEYGQMIEVTDDITIASLVRSDSCITLKGNNNGFVNLYVRRYDKDNKLICDNAFLEIPVTKETVVKTVTADDEMWLYIDMNNDGVYEENACSKKNGEYYFTTRTPVPSAKEGTYNKAFKVTLESETENSIIYYTLDGSEPETNGILYQGEFKIDKTCTLKAVAIRENYTTGDVLEVNYQVKKIGFIAILLVWVVLIGVIIFVIRLSKKKKNKKDIKEEV